MILIEIAALALAIIAGVIVHELTHWLVALVLADQVSIDWRSVTVFSQLEDDAGRWRDYAIGWSPIFAGSTLGVAAWMLGSAPALSMDTASVYLAWMSYSFGGDIDDYLARTVGDKSDRPAPWDDVMDRKREAFETAAKLISTGVLAAGGWLLWPVWWWLALGVGIGVAGIGYYAIEIVAADPRSWDEVMHPRVD